MLSVWVIGASSGIGAALALLMAQNGYTVYISARSEEKLNKLADQHRSIHVFPLDVTQPESLKITYRDIKQQFGPITTIVYAAGTYEPMPLERYDNVVAEKIIRTNLVGAYNTFSAVKDDAVNKNTPMHLVWVASVAGYRGLPQAAAYGPSKAALINFAEIQAIELKSLNTKVQVVNPGFVKTQLTEKNSFHMPQQISSEQAAEKIFEGIQGNKFSITFPQPFAGFFGFLQILPNRLYLWLMTKLHKKDQG